MRGMTQALYFPERAMEAAADPLDTSIVTTDGAKVAIFHPPLDIIPNGTHLLFIPPLFWSDLSTYEERLSEIATRKQSILYALSFPQEASEHDRTRSRMISDALRFCRGGSTAFEIIVCELETFLYVSRDKGWRNGKDTVVTLESLLD